MCSVQDSVQQVDEGVEGKTAGVARTLKGAAIFSQLDIRTE